MEAIVVSGSEAGLCLPPEEEREMYVVEDDGKKVCYDQIYNRVLNVMLRNLNSILWIMGNHWRKNNEWVKDYVE